MDKRLLDKFPDGTFADRWFYLPTFPCVDDYKRRYVITDYGIKRNRKIYTKELQNLIDLAFQDGGG